MPADPRITLADLHDRAAQRANAHDRVILGRAISNEEAHRPPGDARVLVAPRVAEVAPDVHQAEAREGAHGILGGHELKVRVDQVLERVCPPVIEVCTRLAESRREFATVAYQRVNRDKPAFVQPLALHRLEEPLN